MLNLSPKLKRTLRVEFSWLVGLWATIGAYFFVLYRLWKYDFRIPLQYEGDAPAVLMLIKTVVEKGNYLSNSDLGWPFGHNWLDYPWIEQWHILIFRFLAIFTQNQFLIANLFYFFSFLAVGTTAYAVSRRLSLTKISSVVVGVLFAFLPYHLFKGTNHLFLSNYSLIPIVLLWAWWLLGNTKLGLPEWQSWRKSWALWLGLIATGLIGGSSGIYYAFFSSYLIVITGILGALRFRRPLLLLLSGVMIISIMLSIAWNLVPGYLARRQIGPNPEAAQRNPDESQNFGLYWSQMFIPQIRYPFPLTKLQANYSSRGEFTEYLGVVGITGLALLLLSIYIKPTLSEREKLWLPATQVIFFFLLFFGLNNGWGTLFAYLISPQIRAYTRISPYLAFLAMVIFAWWSEKIYSGWRGWKKVLGPVALIAISLFSLFDQTLWLKPKFAWNNFRFQGDKEFFSQVENHFVLAGQPGRIYQFPYVRFPEAVTQYRLEDYDQAKAFLHTKKIQWSYGTIKGREGDRWNQWFMTLPWAQQPKVLVGMGFTGLYVDRFAYTDNGAAVLRAFNESLEREPDFYGGDDNRYAFYNLLPEHQAYQSALSIEERLSIEQALRQPVQVEFTQHRFSGEAKDETGRWRWVDQRADLTLSNPLPSGRKIMVSGKLVANAASAVRIQIDGQPPTTLAIGKADKSVPFSFLVDLPAQSQTVLHWSSSAPKIYQSSPETPYSYKLIDFAATDQIPGK